MRFQATLLGAAYILWLALWLLKEYLDIATWPLLMIDVRLIVVFCVLGAYSTEGKTKRDREVHNEEV